MFRNHVCVDSFSLLHGFMCYEFYDILYDDELKFK